MFLFKFLCKIIFLFMACGIEAWPGMAWGHPGGSNFPATQETAESLQQRSGSSSAARQWAAARQRCENEGVSRMKALPDMENAWRIHGVDEWGIHGVNPWGIRGRSMKDAGRKDSWSIHQGAISGWQLRSKLQPRGKLPSQSKIQPLSKLQAWSKSSHRANSSQ